MLFVEKEDFDKLPYNIPAKQLMEYDGTNISDTVVSPEFDAFCDENEAEILKQLLGLDLYNDFIAGLNPDSVDYPEEKWQKLLDGAEYTYNGITYEWKGMRKLLRPFIFSMWLRDNYDNYNETGVSVAKVENAEMISPALRIVQAWNKFYGMAGDSTKCYTSKTYNHKNTLYGFLKVNFTDYSNWVYTDVGSMNRFNL